MHWHPKHSNRAKEMTVKKSLLLKSGLWNLQDEQSSHCQGNADTGFPQFHHSDALGDLL